MNPHDAAQIPILLQRRLKRVEDIYAILVTQYGWTSEAAIGLLSKCHDWLDYATEQEFNAHFELGRKMGYADGYGEGYDAAKSEYYNLTPEDVAYLLKFFKERTSTSSITAEMKIAAELIELEKLRKEKDNAN